jgi:hypothetical protein
MKPEQDDAIVINNVFKPLVDRLEPADWGVCEEE